MWDDVRRHLKLGREVRAWSRDKGYTGLSFTVTDFQRDSITITSQNLTAPRTIRSSEFSKIASVWARYRRGELSRAQLGRLSHNTTYILGILKCLEESKS